MAVIKTLSVSIDARTAKFRKGMRNARKSLKAFSASVLSVSKRLAGFGSIAIGVAGGAGLAVLVKRSLQSIDAIAKLSDRLNVTTEALSGLGFAAEIMGSSTESMNKALGIFTKNIGEALTGTGEAIRTFKQLGLTAEKLAGMKLDDAFKSVAEQISKLPTAAARVEASFRLLGRQGISFVNLLSLGRGGIEQLQKEAALLGRTFSRLDAAKVELANDAMTRLKALIQGAANVLTIELVPVLQGLAEKITNINTETSNLADSIVSGFRAATLSAAKFGEVFDQIGRFVSGATALVKLPFRFVTGVFEDAANLFRKFLEFTETPVKVKAFKDIRKFNLDFTKSIDKNIAAWKNFNDRIKNDTAFKEINKFFDDVKKRSDELARNVLVQLEGSKMGPFQFANNFDVAAKAGNKLTKQIDDMAKAAINLVRDVELPLERFARKFKDLSLLRFFQKINDSTFGRALKKLKGELSESLRLDIPSVVSKRTADFKQINLSRFAVGGASSGANKKQKVSDDILAGLMQVQNTILQTIAGRTFAAVLP